MYLIFTCMYIILFSVSTTGKETRFGLWAHYNLYCTFTFRLTTQCCPFPPLCSLLLAITVAFLLPAQPHTHTHSYTSLVTTRPWWRTRNVSCSFFLVCGCLLQQREELCLGKGRRRRHNKMLGNPPLDVWLLQFFLTKCCKLYFKGPGQCARHSNRKTKLWTKKLEELEIHSNCQTGICASPQAETWSDCRSTWGWSA